jgi:membrane associated rhomboid family serine protease
MFGSHQITEAAKNIIIINILFYVGTMLFLGDPTNNSWGKYQLGLFYPSSPDFRPYQFVTYMFMHSSPQHIFFNMLGVYMFGSGIEMVWGARRFLFYYLFCGLGAGAIQLLVQYIAIKQGSFQGYIPTVGASGAVFGLMGAYAMLFPKNQISLLVPPVTMSAPIFVLVYGAMELMFGIGGIQTGVAHFAHLGGLVFGIGLILYWRKFGTRL